MKRKLRRVITGHNVEGKSIVAFDGGPGRVLDGIQYTFSEMWVTWGTPANNSRDGDAQDWPDDRKMIGLWRACKRFYFLFCSDKTR